MKKLTITSIVLVSFFNQAVFAAPFRIVGSRAVGVGGAFVAVADGVDAQYWNPGALGLTHGSGFQIPVNASFEATGNILEKADAISKAADALQQAQDAQTNGTGLNLDQVKDTTDALNRILDLNSTGTGAIIDATGGLQTRFGHLAVSVNEYADVGMLPIVDPSLNLGSLNGDAGVTLGGAASTSDPSLDAAAAALAPVLTQLQSSLGLGFSDAQQAANLLVNQAFAGGKSAAEIQNLVNDTAALTNSLIPQLSGTGDINDNQTRVNLTGASMAEASLGYGHTVPFPSNWGSLSVGGNLKAIRGDVGFASLHVVDGEDTSIGDALDDAKKNIKTSVKPAVDMGVMYRMPFKHLTQFGVVGRNLNSPEFDVPDSRISEGLGKYKESAQYRAGMAFWPLKRWMLSADIDLTENKTSVPGFTSQMWGAGTEFKIWLLDLRAGLMKNFGTVTPLTYTAGVGLNFGALKLNLSGAMSSKTVKLEKDGSEIPANAQVAFSLGLVFGQGQEPSNKAKLQAEADSQSVPQVTPAAVAPTTPSDVPSAVPAVAPAAVAPAPSPVVTDPVPAVSSTPAPAASSAPAATPVPQKQAPAKSKKK